MNVLITGGAGYAGSVLSRKLLDKGHKVTIMDNFRFGRESIKDIEDDITIIEGDIMELPDELPAHSPMSELLKDTDAIIHLAALSKEPTGPYNDQYCIDLNYNGTKKIANLAKKAGIDRFVYASSTSTYFSYDIIKDPELSKETDDLNPISPYSITKRASEQFLLDSDLDVVILRPGTHYGVSPRMRMDLVVNHLVWDCFHDGEMTVLKDINRPLVDIETISEAYIAALSVDTGIYNVLDFNTDLESLASRINTILKEHTGQEFDINVKEVDVERNYIADDSKFKKNFDIDQRDFKDAVIELWEFIKENPEDKKEYYNKNM